MRTRLGTPAWLPLLEDWALIANSGPPAALLLLLLEGVLRLLQIFETYASKSDLNKISILTYFDFGVCIQINSDSNQT